MSVNPFGDFRKECKSIILATLSRKYPNVPLDKVELEVPPSPQFGELASTICFDLAKRLRKPPISIAKELVKEMDLSTLNLVESVETANPGYVNFKMNYAKVAKLALEAALDPSYGYVKVKDPLSIIVEHTSANPIHPIHIGTARNPILGDAIARLLSKRGHRVSVHFYVDDVGRQVAIVAYGYSKLDHKVEGKPDHLLGQIYAITNCLINMKKLRNELDTLQKAGSKEKIEEAQKKLDEWSNIALELKGKNPKLFRLLASKIEEDPDPEKNVVELIRAYERGDEKAKELVRKVCNLCLAGFKETLDKLAIRFDSWDWESDFVWGGQVAETLDRLKLTKYTLEIDRALEFNVMAVIKDMNLWGMLGISEDQHVPSLTLTRKDGTTLYTTRDMAYSLWKLEKADLVVNVVGSEQTLAQLQLRVALCLLDGVELAKRQMHFAHGLVEFPGFKMSSRRGRYLTLDSIIDEAIKKAYNEVSKRSPTMVHHEKEAVSKMVGMGSLKFAFASLDPKKNVTFDWDRILSFEGNSGPFVQYAHARACSILRKAGALPSSANYELMKHPLEEGLILMVASFPDVFVTAADELRPNLVAEFALELAEKFNSFYDALPVLKAEDELRNARLLLVKAVQAVLRNALSVLGIEAPERM